MIRLTVNGKEEELPEQTPLPVYLESLGVTLRRIAVAYNGEVVRREGHADGDAVGRRHGGDSTRRRRRLRAMTGENFDCGHVSVG